MGGIDIYKKSLYAQTDEEKAQRQIEIEEAKKRYKEAEIQYHLNYPKFLKNILYPTYLEMVDEFRGYIITEPDIIRKICLYGNKHIWSIVENYKPEVEFIFMFELVPGQKVFTFVKEAGNPYYEMKLLDGNWSQFYVTALCSDSVTSKFLKIQIKRLSLKHYPRFLL